MRCQPSSCHLNQLNTSEEFATEKKSYEPDKTVYPVCLMLISLIISQNAMMLSV